MGLNCDDRFSFFFFLKFGYFFVSLTAVVVKSKKKI